MQQPKRKCLTALLLLMFFSACALPPTEEITTPVSPSPQLMATEATLPALTTCDRQGTLGSDHVPEPTQGFDIGFSYYLPPCYEELTNVRFPVIYLITMPLETSLSATDRTPMSLAERLIHSGRMPPAIIVVPDDIIDYGYHAALAKDLVPYVDGKLRTLADRRYRGVGGISHGAAIAARMAFEFPSTFGSAGLLSGGIAASEKERFEAWIARTPAENWPRLLINVGEQDGIMALTSNLLEVLDRDEFPYTLQLGQGGHSWEYWSAQMESYLLWFADAW